MYTLCLSAIKKPNIASASVATAGLTRTRPRHQARNVMAGGSPKHECIGSDQVLALLATCGSVFQNGHESCIIVTQCCYPRRGMPAIPLIF